jgi:hypothetical protein
MEENNDDQQKMEINNEKFVPKKKTTISKRNSLSKKRLLIGGSNRSSKKIKLQSNTSESINTEEIIKPKVSSSDAFMENVISDKIDSIFNNHYIKTT